MMDDIYLGESPCAERCTQVGSDGYGTRAMKECQALINQLRRVFGEEPDGATLVIRTEHHSEGSRYAVHCKFDSNKMPSIDYAFKCESEYPEHWDLLAKQELHILPDYVSVTEEHLLFEKRENADG